MKTTVIAAALVLACGLNPTRSWAALNDQPATLDGVQLDAGEAKQPLTDSEFKSTVRRGSPGFDWIEASVGHGRLADRVDLTIRYLWEDNVKIGGNIEDEVLGHVASRSKSTIIPEGPLPEGPGSTIGREISTYLNCTSISHNHTPRNADIEYEWEWQYTVDSNRDGTNDSEPGWVLTGTRITYLPMFNAEMCQ